MATIKLPSGGTIQTEEEKVSYKLPSGGTVVAAGSTTLNKIQPTPLPKRVVQSQSQSNNTPSMQQSRGNALDVAKQVIAKQQPTRQMGIGFQQPTVKPQPLPYAKKVAQTLPRVEPQTLQKAQQISQQAQGKTAEQLRQQNLQNIKKNSVLNREINLDNVLGANAYAGLTQVNKGLAQTADFILPDFLTPKKLQQGLDYYKNTADAQAQHAANVNKEHGVSDTVGGLIQGTVAAIPNAILAMISGGTSLGAQTIGQTSTGFIGSVGTAVKELAKNPMFYSSLVQTAGSEYEQAKANGATEMEATITAIIGSIVNAGIEIGGGIEAVAKNPISLKNWVKGMLDEGKEEVLQGIISQAAAKATYDKDKKWVSATDENAVINPLRMGEEFLGGAVVGGVLGGGQMLAGKALGMPTEQDSYLPERGENATAAELAGRLDINDTQPGKLPTITRREQRALDALSAKTGMTIQLDDDIKGGNGYYDAATNTMHISRNSNNGIYQVGAHEITHAIKAQNAEEWNQLLELANANLSAEGRANLESVLQKTGYTGEQMQEEVVAHYVQQCVTDIKSFEQLVGVNRTLAQRIVDAFESFVRKLTGQQNIGGQMETEYLRTVMGDITPEQAQQTLAQMKKSLAAGGQTIGEGAQIDNPAQDGEVEISTETGTASASYSLKTWNETDKQQVVNDLVKQNGVTPEQAQKWVDDVNGVARIIASDRMLYDYEANPNYTALKKNDEYIRTVDMSTNCKKRILLAGTIDEIQRRLPNTALSGEEYIRIRQMMKDAGYEVSCGFCYVESRRKELGNMAEKFVKQLGDPTVTIADLTTEAGINYLQQYRKDVYDAYVQFNKDRGSGKVNLVESRTEYNGEIMDTNKDRGLTRQAVAKLNRMGGLRAQSYSDFETPHLIDMMQVVVDMSRRGLMSQAYTKVPNFADALGLTGMKINLSLVTSGLDAGGNLIFDGVEGMPIEDAMRLRELYSENVGTILVGKDDATILAAMADPRIDFIIPYHRSGWAKAEYEALGLTGYDDYTSWQHERWLVPRKNSSGDIIKRPKSNYYPGEYWDYSKTGKENAEIYLAKCAAEGRIPKFNNFLVDNGDGSWSLQPDGSTDGYWKTLIDFKMYDNNGVGVPQRVVKPEFNPEVLERIMSEYKGDHRNTQVANDIVEKFLASRLSRKIIGNAVTEQEAKQAIENRRRQLPYGPNYKAANSPSEAISIAQASNLPKDTKSSYGGNTVGAAQPNVGSYANLQTEHGVVDPGENPARIIDMPVKDANGQVNSLFARTTAESKHMPKKMVEDWEKAVASGEFSHAVFGDRRAKNYAEHHVSQGFEHAWPLWRAVADGSKVATKEDIALGELLLAHALKDGQTELAMQITAELCAEATRAGQNVQAFRLLKKMTPEGQLFYLQKVANKLNKQFEGRKGFDGIKLSEDQVKELSQASTKEEMEKAVDKIKQDIADQTPVTFEDKWNAWRYLAMLGNARTQVRNIFGNAFFLPVVKTKNLIATGIEGMAKKRLPEATKALLNPVKDKSLISYGTKDFENVKAEVSGGNKYTDQQDILSKRRIFKLENIERARIITNDVMEWGDRAFSKGHYATSLASYMKANKLNPDTITPEQLNKARNYAIKEAQKATFRDANAFASFLNATKKNMAAKSRNADTMLGKVGWKAAEAVAEGIIPFTKTPANIMARGIEYSPVGLLWNLATDGSKIKSGKMTAAEAIDKIAAGLTGTGLFALGCFLASAGAVTGAAGDDKEDKYNAMLGEQEYALKVGDGSYTIDWLAPAALPFFTGVAVYNELAENGKFELAQIFDAMSAIGEPLFELSMVQGIDSALGASKYSDQAPIISVLSNAAFGYVGQGVPTSFGQVARAVDKTRRQTYYDPNYKGIVKEGLAVGQKQLAKTPGSFLLEPKVDMWGREQENEGGSFVGRLAYNMLSPGYASGNKATAVDKELQSLYKKTGESSVLPSYADKTFELPADLGGEKVKLNAKEYTEYAKAKGGKAYDIFDSVIGTKNWNSLSDDEKVEAASLVYKYANAIAKTKVSDYTLTEMEDGKVKKNKDGEVVYRDVAGKIQKCEKAGIPAGVTIVAYIAQKDIVADKDSKGNSIPYSKSEKQKEAIDRMTPFINKKQRDLLYDLFDVSEKVR